MITTHEKIRVESGFQSRYMRQAFLNNPAAGVTSFFVNSDDYVKIVPEFGTGNIVAGTSDVQVWCGMSGVLGSSRMEVSSIDSDTGRVTLSSSP